MRPSGTRPAVDPRQAGEALKRFQTEKTASRNSVARYLETADQALAADNPVSAASALRVAVSLKPNDKALAERLEATEELARASLKRRFLDLAEQHLRQGQLLQAAELYEKAAATAHKADLYKKAAECLLSAQTDLRRAGQMVKQALALDSQDTENHVLLARIYAAAGMKRSAIGELERAAREHPGDASIDDWLRRLKREEL